jgi:hypothetical protein
MVAIRKAKPNKLRPGQLAARVQAPGGGWILDLLKSFGPQLLGAYVHYDSGFQK